MVECTPLERVRASDRSKSSNLLSSSKFTYNQFVNTKILTLIAFSLVAVIYFSNAAYSYFYNIEGQVVVNIGLGIMFLIIGLSGLVTSSEK